MKTVYLIIIIVLYIFRTLIQYSILYFFANLRPLAFGLSETTKTTFIGDFFLNENFIRFLKLLPVPDMKIAVLSFLGPTDLAIQSHFIRSSRYFTDNIRLIIFIK